MEDRDYKFTDEEVTELGFVSYEELEQYYDLLYSKMKNNFWNKHLCTQELEETEQEYRLNYSRKDRLKSVIDDYFGIIEDWDATTWIPSLEEISNVKTSLSKSLDMYFKYLGKQNKKGIEQIEPLEISNLGGR